MSGLTFEQLHDLRGRLDEEISRCLALQGINSVYAAEANAYRRVLATLDEYAGRPSGPPPPL